MSKERSVHMAIFNYGQTEIDHLRKRDKRLGQMIDRIGLLEPGVTSDIFSALVNSIVAQQISSKAAETVWGRVKDRFVKITPERMASATVEKVQCCGMSMRKASYIKGMAEACVKGEIDLDALWGLPDEEVVKRLSSLHGIGVWTAEMILIFCMQRPDIVSWNDLGIRRGMMRLYELDELSRADFERYRKRYSPYGTIASFYLWEMTDGTDD
ncbi:MAG: DNA-3-methyladenine glycosylase [Methanomassiliicoccales archaeon]|nr:DNA-3-methyladenine glycosylase [Methanomassiliicoccales archaeon]